METDFTQNLQNETSDKKLREFGDKAFHRILVTNKELKQFKIRNDDLCFQCKNPDSSEHTFLEFPMSVQFYQEILSWFTTSNNTDWICLSIKRYIYICKINEKNLNNLQFINKIKMQWKIENLT